MVIVMVIIMVTVVIIVMVIVVSPMLMVIVTLVRRVNGMVALCGESTLMVLGFLVVTRLL